MYTQYVHVQKCMRVIELQCTQKMYMYIKYKLSDFEYDFVHAKICTCTKVYYSFIQKCTADIGHRNHRTIARYRCNLIQANKRVGS